MNAKEWLEANGISVEMGKLRTLAQEASPMAPFFRVLMERLAEQYAAYKVQEFAASAVQGADYFCHSAGDLQKCGCSLHDYARSIRAAADAFGKE